MPTNLVEVVSKPQIKFKGKASGRSGKRSLAAGGMAIKKACNAAIAPQMGF